MIVVLMGAPGAGKGTQGDMLVERQGFRKISTGDVLRQEIKAGSDIGRAAKALVESGKLVPDHILLEIIKKNLSQAGARVSVILDGYPRNLAQAESLDSLGSEFKVDKAISLEVPRDVLIERLCGRRTCGSCGAIYHISSLSGKYESECRKCGGNLTQRRDDSKEFVETRLEIFRSETQPIIQFYEDKGVCHHIDGNRDPESIFDDLVKVLEKSL